MATFTATVQTGKVSGTNSNFPAYVDLSTLPIAFWNVVANGGGDIRVYTDSTLTTEIPREVVSCNTATDTGELWCKVGSMTSSTQVWITVDGTSADYARNATYGSDNVQRSTERVVYRMQSNSNDSTVNARNGTDTNTPTYTAGKQGNAFTAISSSSQYTSIPNASVNWATNKIRMSSWLKLSATSGNQSILMTGRTGQGILFYKSGTNSIVFSKPNVVDLVYTWTGIDTNYHKWDLVADASGMRIYLDGNSTPVATSTNTNNFVSPSTDTLTIGAYKSAGAIQSAWYLNGQLDDFRINSEPETTDVYATEYQNQNDNSAFWGTWSEVSGVTNQSNFFLLF